MADAKRSQWLRECRRIIITFEMSDMDTIWFNLVECRHTLGFSSAFPLKPCLIIDRVRLKEDVEAVNGLQYTELTPNSLKKNMIEVTQCFNTFFALMDFDSSVNSHYHCQV